MSSLLELIQRTEAIAKKYEKYDAMVKPKAAKGADKFTEEFEAVNAQVERLMALAVEVAEEQNRAVVASKNAEIRRQKNEILGTQVDALNKNIRKGPGKTVMPKDVIDERVEQIKALVERLQSIPDGTTLAAKKPFRPGAASDGLFGRQPVVQLDTSNLPSTSAEDYQHTAETRAFEQEWLEAKQRQDEALDRIEKGVAVLGDMAKGMGEELEKQAPILNEMETQMDRVASDLRNNNARLKGIVQKMRTTRSFCIDVILICLLLGIGAYVYSLVK